LKAVIDPKDDKQNTFQTEKSNTDANDNIQTHFRNSLNSVQ